MIHSILLHRHPERSEGSARRSPPVILSEAKDRLAVVSRRFFVYILSDRTRCLYTGVTNDLIRRVGQHRLGLIPGFTRRYNIHHLVYFELTDSPRAAIAREKEIKGWLRRRKIELIERVNPQWRDLSEGWFG